MDTHRGEGWLEHRRQELFADPAERKACQCDAELSRRQIGIEMRTNVFREARAQISFFDQRIQLAAPHLYDREFARDEKSIERDQREDRGDFRQQQFGRIPMLGDAFSQGGKGERSEKQKAHCADACPASGTLRGGRLPAGFRYAGDHAG